MPTNYLSCAETAKLIRQALKESFPGIKFSVKSSTYSIGASIRIRWLDGPNTKQVESVSGVFEGAYFDGMIDYKGSRYHTLDGIETHFGADYIFENRDFSDAAVQRAIDAVVREYKGECKPITPAEFHNGASHSWSSIGGCDLGRALWGVLSKHSDRLAVKDSPTLARVRFTGDDGYGQGTVGRHGSGGDLCAKAVAQNRERMRA